MAEFVTQVGATPMLFVGLTGLFVILRLALLAFGGK